MPRLPGHSEKSKRLSDWLKSGAPLYGRQNQRSNRATDFVLAFRQPDQLIVSFHSLVFASKILRFDLLCLKCNLYYKPFWSLCRCWSLECSTSESTSRRSREQGELEAGA